MNLEQILAREQFTRWLEGQAGDTIVGYARTNNACPLAQYLYASGYSAVYVGTRIAASDPLATHPRRQCAVIDTPLWAVEFMLALDTATDYREPVCVARVRSILSTIPQEGVCQ